MNSATFQHYFQTEVTLAADPLTIVSRLASSGLYADYAVYENQGQWSFAGGALAEVYADITGTTVRYEARTTHLPWRGCPLREVRNALDTVPLEGWRAYGWAAFELAYAKDGDTRFLGDQRLLHLMFPRTEVRIEHGTATVKADGEKALADVLALLFAMDEGLGRQPSPVDIRRAGSDHYQQAVERAVAAINAGKFDKVIISRTVPLEDQIDFISTYIHGRRGNTPARSFLLRMGGIESVGFSPEIVVQVDAGGRVVSQPLAGTRALTEDAASNARLRAELLSDSKEIYEHAISVKTALDDLRGACDANSLIVEEFMHVSERGSVQHLGSRVVGQLAKGRDAWDAFGAAFPAVTASGVPKDAAYTSIRDLESRGRGLYAGSVLTIDHDGAMDAALVLRAVYRQNGMTWLQAGAGIVGQSRPAREFEETCEKLDSVARFLVPADHPAGGPLAENVNGRR